jgi:hypothetical protein
MIVVTAIIIGLTACLRWRSAEFRRPLEGDELDTLLDHTFVGITPGGTQRILRHIDELRGLPRPGLRHLAMGVWCSLGRWSTPNNHVVNSVLINGAMARGQPDEATIRLPALLGAIAFAMLLVPVLIRFGGTWPVVPIAVFCALWHPFLVRYSLEARGYTWMLALQVAMLLAVTFLAARPTSIAWGILLAVISALTVMNIVSLAVDWVLPFYLTLLFLPPRVAATTEPDEADGPPTSQLRKNASIQILAISVAGLIFFIDRLPYLVVSAERYGLHFSTLNEFFARLKVISTWLFPSVGWKIFAVFGLAGLFLAARSVRERWLGALLVMTLVIVLGRSLLTRTLPYERVCGFVVPFVLLGAANLARVLLEQGRTPAWQGATWAVLVCGSLAVVWSSYGVAINRMDSRVLELNRAARQMAEFPGGTRMTLGDPRDMHEVRLYLPAGWLSLYDRLPSRGQVEIEVILDEKYWGIYHEPGSGTRASQWRENGWCDQRRVMAAGDRCLIPIPGNTYPFNDFPSGGPSRGKAIVFWYPDIMSVITSQESILGLVRRSGLCHFELRPRMQLKMLIGKLLNCVVFVAETPAECEAVARQVTAGIDRFGGDAVVFVPWSSSEGRGSVRAAAH